MPGMGDAVAAPSGDRRSTQILVAAAAVAVAIIVGAGVMRARAARPGSVAVTPGGTVPVALDVPPVPPVPSLPPVPPPPEPSTTMPSPAPEAAHNGAAAADAGAAQDPASDASPAARQREIVDEARRLTDPATAIGMYSQAIELEPQSLAARDALFERAKLYLATGDREHARADVQKLKRRADAKDLERDLQLILDGANVPGGGP